MGLIHGSVVKNRDKEINNKKKRSKTKKKKPKRIDQIRDSIDHRALAMHTRLINMYFSLLQGLYTIDKNRATGAVLRLCSLRALANKNQETGIDKKERRKKRRKERKK